MLMRFLASVDDEIRKTQLGGNGKCVALSRNSDEQTVSGTQGLYIKFTAGIFHAVGGKGVNLQLAVVGGCHGPDSLLMKEGENGNGKCGPLCGIRTGTKLVEKYQRVLICFLEERHHIGHVGGEGT